MSGFGVFPGPSAAPQSVPAGAGAGAIKQETTSGGSVDKNKKLTGCFRSATDYFNDHELSEDYSEEQEESDCQESSDSKGGVDQAILRAFGPGAAAAAHARGPGEGSGHSSSSHAVQEPNPQVSLKSQFRGVSYDKKKRKWRVQIKVAALGKSGVSVGYFDTETAAARAYDRAAIGLLGWQNCKAILNYPIEEYDRESIPELVGKSREEVKATLKSERAKMPRRRLTNRRRTSKYLGVGSSNRKNQWQARILYHGKVTHLGYYRTEEEAARVYDRVSISLHGEGAQTNFPLADYSKEVKQLQVKLAGLTREELQRALGVKPMDKSSQYRGVSKKKGKWEAKVMLNRKWAYRELYDTEEAAARAYDTALWRLKPREARPYVNFKDSCPADVAELLAALECGAQQHLALTPSGLPVTAQPLIDAGLLFDEEGQAIRSGMTKVVSESDLHVFEEHNGPGPRGSPQQAGGGGGAKGAKKARGMPRSASHSAMSQLTQMDHSAHAGSLPSSHNSNASGMTRVHSVPAFAAYRGDSSPELNPMGRPTSFLQQREAFSPQQGYSQGPPPANGLRYSHQGAQVSTGMVPLADDDGMHVPGGQWDPPGMHMPPGAMPSPPGRPMLRSASCSNLQAGSHGFGAHHGGFGGHHGMPQQPGPLSLKLDMDTVAARLDDYSNYNGGMGTGHSTNDMPMPMPGRQLVRVGSEAHLIPDEPPPPPRGMVRVASDSRLCMMHHQQHQQQYQQHQQFQQHQQHQHQQHQQELSPSSSGGSPGLGGSLQRSQSSGFGGLERIDEMQASGPAATAPMALRMPQPAPGSGFMPLRDAHDSSGLMDFAPPAQQQQQQPAWFTSQPMDMEANQHQHQHQQHQHQHQQPFVMQQQHQQHHSGLPPMPPSMPQQHYQQHQQQQHHQPSPFHSEPPAMGSHPMDTGSRQADWWPGMAPPSSSMEGVVLHGSPRAQQHNSSGRHMDSGRPSWMASSSSGQGGMDMLGMDRSSSPFPSFGLQIGGEEIDMGLFKEEPGTAPASPLISNFFNDAPLHEQPAQLLAPHIKAEEGL